MKTAAKFAPVMFAMVLVAAGAAAAEAQVYNGSCGAPYGYSAQPLYVAHNAPCCDGGGGFYGPPAAVGGGCDPCGGAAAFSPCAAPCGPRYCVRRGLLGQPTIYVPGQPIRNFFRYFSP